MMGWDTPATNFLTRSRLRQATNRASGNGSGQTWQTTSKNYPNAIFEAWNEPGYNGGDTEPIPSRIHDIPTNNVQRNQSNRSNQPNHVPMAHGLGSKRLGRNPRLGIKHKQRIPPNKRSLHHTLLLLRTIRQLSTMGKRLRNTKNSSAICYQQHGRNSSISNQRRRLMPNKFTKQTKRLHLVAKHCIGSTRLRRRRRSILLAKRLRLRPSLLRRNNANKRLLTKHHGNSIHQRCAFINTNSSQQELLRQPPQLHQRQVLVLHQARHQHLLQAHRQLRDQQ